MGAEYDPDEEPEGGDLVCWAALVCTECGAMTTEGHRPGCPTQPRASTAPADSSRLTPMHLEHTAVVVDDYDRAIDFFVNALGFELVEDSPDLTTVGQRPKRWVVVRPPGAQTGLLLAQADGPDQQAAVGRQLMAEAERQAVTAFAARRLEMTLLAQQEKLIAYYERRGFRRTGETRPFPADPRYARPLRDDLHFVVLEKSLR